MTDETENLIMSSILFDIFGIRKEEDMNFDNIKMSISKNNIIIKFRPKNTDFLLDCNDIL